MITASRDKFSTMRDTRRGGTGANRGLDSTVCGGNKMRLILRVFAITVLSGAIQAALATNVSGTQTGTWTLAGSPYLIIGDVTVPAGQSLAIEPGVIVNAQGYYRITVNGT